jgi:hypothetical protein
MIHSKCQAIEFKSINWIALNGGRKKGESENEGKSTEVVENKCRRNVSFRPCTEVIEK